MLGALFDIHAKFNGWTYTGEGEKVQFIDEIPFL